MTPMMIIALMGALLLAVPVDIGFYSEEDEGDGGDAGDGGGESLTGGVSDTGDTGTDILSVATGDALVGTDGNDTIALADGATGPLSVDAGAGNDVIDLHDESLVTDATPLPDLIGDSTILGGSGNDLIDAQAEGSEIDGGLGNDTVTGAYIDSLIDTGIGNDLIDVTSPNGAATINGGDGADTITADLDNGGLVDGGAGNDQLAVYAGTAAGSSYSVNGGAGNDFFTIDATDLPTSAGEGAFAVTGGNGIDVYQLTTNEGLDDPALWNGGQVSVLTDGTLRVELGEITDFTPGEDLLVISGAPVSDGFSLESVEAEERMEGIGTEALYSTEVRLTYTTDGQPDRQVVIDLPGAEMLDSLDIQLVGADPSLLEIITLTRPDPGGELLVA